MLSSHQLIDSELYNQLMDSLRKLGTFDEKTLQALYNLYMTGEVHTECPCLQPLKQALMDSDSSLTAKQVILDVLAAKLIPNFDPKWPNSHFDQDPPDHLLSLPKLLALGSLFSKSNKLKLVTEKLYLNSDQIEAFFAGCQTKKLTVLGFENYYVPNNTVSFNPVKFNEIISELRKLDLSSIEMLDLSCCYIGMMSDDQLPGFIICLKDLRTSLPALKKVNLYNNHLDRLTPGQLTEVLSAFGEFPSGLSLSIGGNNFGLLSPEKRKIIYAALTSLNVIDVCLEHYQTGSMKVYWSNDDWKQFFADLKPTPVRHLALDLANGIFKHKGADWYEIFFKGIADLKLTSLSLLLEYYKPKVIDRIFINLKSTSVKELDLSSSCFDFSPEQWNAFIKGLEVARICKVNLSNITPKISFEMQQRINQVILRNNIGNEFANGSLKTGIFCKIWSEPKSEVAEATNKQESKIPSEIKDEFVTFPETSGYLRY